MADNQNCQTAMRITSQVKTHPPTNVKMTLSVASWVWMSPLRKSDYLPWIECHSNQTLETCPTSFTLFKMMTINLYKIKRISTTYLTHALLLIIWGSRRWNPPVINIKFSRYTRSWKITVLFSSNDKIFVETVVRLPSHSRKHGSEWSVIGLKLEHSK